MRWARLLKQSLYCKRKRHGSFRWILLRHMGFSKPSISHAVGVLKNGGFLTVDEDGYLHLTEDEREAAEKIYENILRVRDNR